MAASARRGEVWFEALPAGRNNAFVAEWHAGLARDAELAVRDVHRGRCEVLHVTLRFAVADMPCPGPSFASFAAALAIGAATGALLHKVDAGRCVDGAVGLTAFIALQFLTRGGMSGLHLFALFSLISVLAYWGWLREERGVD